MALDPAYSPVTPSTSEAKTSGNQYFYRSPEEKNVDFGMGMRGWF